MEAINDGGPAFPVLERGASGLELTCTGMSQRALFAAILMHAELVTDGVPGEACDALVRAASDSGREVEDQMAFNAVLCADALLRALAEPPEHVETEREREQDRTIEHMRDVFVAIEGSSAFEQLDSTVRSQIEKFTDDIPF